MADDVPDNPANRTPMERKLAQDVLTIAATGGMPDTYWATDSRITRAREVLGWDVVEAQAFAEGK